MSMTLLQVALGGAIGASGRYLTGIGAAHLFGKDFPWSTVIVNVVGSFVMGLIVVGLAHWSATRFAPFLMIGVLGGFTTFSAFSLDAVILYERGETLMAAGYVAGSAAASIAALMAGLLLARSVLT